MTKKALITGITGQDGSYLAEHLLTSATRCTGLSAVLRSRTLSGDSAASSTCLTE